MLEQLVKRLGMSEPIPKTGTVMEKMVITVSINERFLHVQTDSLENKSIMYKCVTETKLKRVDRTKTLNHRNWSISK